MAPQTSARRTMAMGAFAAVAISLLEYQQVQAFVLPERTCRVTGFGTQALDTMSTALFGLYNAKSQRGGRDMKTKRQERVGHLVKSELSSIIQSGNIKGYNSEFLEDHLRRRISIVSVDVSPDLRQARVSVSVRAPTRTLTDDDDDDEIPADNYSVNFNPSVDKRRAYAWLVRNAKPLRHTLAQRMSHIKTSPNLSFVQVDVAAAVDVMNLIDKVASGYTRPSIGELGENTNGFPDGFFDDYEDDDDDEDWDDEDDEFFN